MNIKIYEPGLEIKKENTDDVKTIIYEAYRSKFFMSFEKNSPNIKKLLSLMYDCDLFPTKEAFYAVNEDSAEILGLIWINRFKPTSFIKMFNFIIKSLKITNPINVMKLFRGFYILDNLNLRSKKDCIFDVYLAAVKEKYRGFGIGENLLNSTLNYLKDRNEKGIISLVVYSLNRAVNLYKRVGFKIVETHDTSNLAKLIGEEFHTHYIMQMEI